MKVEVNFVSVDVARVRITSESDGVNPIDVFEFNVVCNSATRYYLELRAGDGVEFIEDTDEREPVEAPTVFDGVWDSTTRQIEPTGEDADAG